MRLGNDRNEIGTRFLDYLALAKDNITDYRDRTAEILTDLGIPDFSVAKLDEKSNVIQHFQTAPASMYAQTAKASSIDIVTINAVNNPGKPILLSSLEKTVRESKALFSLFRGFIDVFQIIQDHGYSDYINIPIRTIDNKTIVLSASSYDTSGPQLRDILKNNNPFLLNLAESVTQTFPHEEKLKDILTVRQVEIYSLMAMGLRPIEIAARLSVSKGTVDKHTSFARSNTELTNEGIVAQAIREGILEIK
jgi:DNA-binding NarL/FixJ family response regulator